MDYGVASLGCIRIVPRPEDRELARVSAMSATWQLFDGGDCLELVECGGRQHAGNALRHLVSQLFEPRGFVLDGVVVVEGDDGEIFSVTARANRVTTRQLHPGEVSRETSYEPAPRPPRGPASPSDRCQVIDLDTRRTARG